MPSSLGCVASRKSEVTPTQASCFEMADLSESTPPLENLRSVSEPSCCMDASSDSAYVTAVASEREPTIPSSSTTFFPACCEPMSSERRKAASGDDTSVENTIERSKAHWSELTEHSECNESDEEAKVSNVEVFRSLQMHPTWGHFFRTFGDGGIHNAGELEVGEKFAEGGQAELYHARVTWKDPSLISQDQDYGLMYVLKVFRKGTFLRDLQTQWPEGMFRQREEIRKRHMRGYSQPVRYTCLIQCGTLLEDGRFAFLLVRENEDLRTLIDRCMKARTSIDSGPFSKERSIQVMYAVASGMFELHKLNIVHRDLKASNVLRSRLKKKLDKYVYDFNVAEVEVAIVDDCNFYVADFECSIGVVGTGFFRAPEVLQALKDKVVNKIPNLFTKEGDIYSYGMLCYEILTGKLPFEGHSTNDYDLVLDGGRPEVPHHVEEWACDLLCRCWQSNPAARPTFAEILNVLEEAHKKHWSA